MDIVSHGLWGGIAFGRRNKQNFRLAFFFGIAPDLFSFGIFFMERLLAQGVLFSRSRPDLESIPLYVDVMYNLTHSLVVFLAIFCFVWFLLGKPLYVMLSWPLHIITDIFTHSTAFFPTPFLWPILDYTFNGIGWGHPLIFFPNLILLVFVYAWFYYKETGSK